MKTLLFIGGLMIVGIAFDKGKLGAWLLIVLLLGMAYEAQKRGLLK